MKEFIPCKKFVSLTLIAAMFHLCWISSNSWAHLAVTETVIGAGIENLSQRENIRALINRKDVQVQLEQYGLSREEALARLNSLTDAEIAELAAQIEQLPEGQGHGVAVFLLTIIAVIMLAGLVSLGVSILAGIFNLITGDSSQSSDSYEEPASEEEESTPEEQEPGHRGNTFPTYRNFEEDEEKDY
ncbi:MAG: PA2779 family protein [Nitrospinae bacterium]|nr:PA2779 family protein [Nitrospinota bacterium]